MTTVHRFATGEADHCPFMPVFGAPTIELVRGSGTEVWDSFDKRYLDFLAGIAVVSLGHANPVIAEALSKQASTLVHVSNFFANPAAARAAIALEQLLFETTRERGQLFFTNSGAESIECAIKLARRYGRGERYGIISTVGSFHGRTLGALAATGQPAKQAPFAPMPAGFDHVVWGDISALEDAVSDESVAILVEPIQGEGGVVPAPHGYLAQIRDLCDRRDLLLIVDEIQTGFGRTGRWFGFEHDGVVPDVVTLAKAMGNGVPVGACWARREIAGHFRPGDHGSTYSATALVGAVVEAVIGEMRRIDAPRLARERGAALRDALIDIDGVAEVRGAGLLLGVGLHEPRSATRVAALALDAGLIVNAVNDSTIRLAPPLTVTPHEIEEAVGILAAAIAEAGGSQ